MMLGWDDPTKEHRHVQQVKFACCHDGHRVSSVAEKSEPRDNVVRSVCEDDDGDPISADFEHVAQVMRAEGQRP
jgi:hypothetical protein